MALLSFDFGILFKPRLGYRLEEESMPLLVTITTIVNIGTLLKKAYLPSIQPEQR